jgi:hypothetical protein
LLFRDPRSGNVLAPRALKRHAHRILALAVLTACAHSALTTRDQVLDRYKEALGGVDAIQQVRSETRRGEIEASNMNGKATFVAYSKPFKSLFKVTRPDGSESAGGFDGRISWNLGKDGASIDKDTPVESVRRDADLQYALHQPDYFTSFELKGVADFEGRKCYWLHGITHWNKDNNQFYDVETGLLAGYRFQSDDSSSEPAVVAFTDYRKFGNRLVATRTTLRTAKMTRIFTVLSVNDDPLPDSLFELPPQVEALLR